jgi:H+/Cl- antiporter ClcA
MTTDDPTADSPAPNLFWRTMASAVMIGLFAGLAALVFFQLLSWGTKYIWGAPDTVEFGGGQWWWVAACAAAGAVVGVLRRLLRVPDDLAGPIAILSKGSVDAKSAPAAVLVSLVSLVGGASMGPFDAGTRSGAAVGHWWHRITKGREEERELAVLNGSAAGLGGLLTAPLIATVLILEVHRHKFRDYLAYLVPNLTAAVIGFGIFYVTVGSSFYGVFIQDEYDVEVWHFGAAALMGLLAGGTAWVLEIAVGWTARTSRRWIPNLTLRCTVGGAVFGLVAVALPATFGSGKEQLALLSSEAGMIGVGLLLAIVLGKIVAMAASLGTGFIGGPLMPALFLGGTLGLLVTEAVPAIPGPLAFSCMLVGVAGTSLRAPISIGLLVLLTTGLGPVEGTPAVVAAIAAYIARHGTASATLPETSLDLPSAAGAPPKASS